MVQIRNQSCIEVCSDMNEWMDCIFLVDRKDQVRAVKVLSEAFDEYWESNTAECYGDWLESKMKRAGIGYEVFYAGGKDEGRLGR